MYASLPKKKEAAWFSASLRIPDGTPSGDIIMMPVIIRKKTSITEEES